MKTVVPLLFFSLVSVSLLAQTDRILKLEKRLETAKDTVRVNTLNKLVALYLTNDVTHADSLAVVARGALDGLDYAKGRIVNLNHLTYTKGAQGQFEPALNFSDESIRQSEELGDKTLLAETYMYRYVLLFQKGLYEDARESAEKAMEYATAINSQKLMAKGYDNLGVLSGIKGEHSQAIEYFMKSLEYYEKINNLSGIADAYNHLGHTFELAQSYDKAMEYLKKAIATCSKINDKFSMGWALVNLGVVYSRVNQYDTALVIYHRALEVAEQIKDQRLILTCLDNIGGKYSLTGDFKNANLYLRRAYKLSEKSGRNSRAVYIIGNLAENYLYMKKYDSAKLFGERQLDLALSSGLISEQKVAYYNLAQIYDSLGDYESAKRSLLGYIAVNDSIFNSQKSQQIEMLRESFEAEKKEQEIDNLKIVNENAQLRNRAYAGVAISFLLLGGLVYYIQRSRTKRNRLLLEKEQEVDRMKSRFFTNISHEFRTPLTLILGPITDMLSKTNDVTAKRQLATMERNANRLLELVNQLLDLSKIESGSLKLHTSKCDIITVLKGVTLSFHSAVEQKEINLVIDVTVEELIMSFDRGKFETILTNLLGNAVKFTPPKGTITVSARIKSEEGRKPFDRFLEISVTDTGNGIPEKDVPNIFNRFYQSDDNQLLQHEGSGIGLALSKELVELHGGKIQATSQLQQGTQIVFDIPTTLSESSVGTLNETSSGHEIHTSVSGYEPLEIAIHDNVDAAETRSMVLVVEDHTEVQGYIYEILKDKYVVLFASDGEQGIVKATENIPDIIISDVMMQKKDGYEVSRTLKNDERTSHIPVILLTAKANREDKIEGLRTNADDYITKPFVPDELLARVENLIESRRMLRAKYKKESTLKPSDVAENSIDEKFLTRLMNIVESQISNEHFGVEQLGEEIGMSRSQLHRKLKALIDQGPNQFIRTFRLNRAHDLLQQRVATSAEVAYRVGFGSPSYFSKCFHDQFGYTPSEIFSKVAQDIKKG